MTVSILIDTSKMVILKRVEDKNSVALCEAWATLLIPHHDFLVVGEERRYLSVFSVEELYALGETAGGFIPESSNYAAVLLWVTNLYQDLDIDETTLETIQERIQKQQEKNPALIPEPFVANPKMTRTPKESFKSGFDIKGTQTGRAPSASGTVNKSNKPKAGSTTGRVWEIADNLYTAGAEITKQLRTSIIDECVRQGINSSTAATQYSKWRKSALPT